MGIRSCPGEWLGLLIRAAVVGFAGACCFREFGGTSDLPTLAFACCQMERRQSARLCQACLDPKSHKLKHVCGKGRGKRSMDDVVEPAACRQRSGDQSCEVAPMLPELLFLPPTRQQDSRHA